MPDHITLFFSLIWIMIIGVGVSGILWHLSFRRLKSHHPQKYSELYGDWSIVNTQKSMGPVFTFFSRREHRSLGDSYLSAICDILILVYAAMVVSFLGIFIYLLLTLD